jgi:hypothetical protein
MALPNQPFAPDATVGFFQTGKSGQPRDNHAVAKGDFRLSNSSNLAVTYTRGRPFRREPAVDIRNDGTFYGFQERGSQFVTSGAA